MEPLDNHPGSRPPSWRTRAAHALELALLPVAIFLAARALGAWAEGDGDDQVVVCRHAEVDRGSADRIDVAGVKRAYAGLKKDLEKSLAVQKTKAIANLDLAHDAGLPRCGAAKSRRIALDAPLPESFRSRSFYFVRLDGGFEDVPWEREIASSDRAEVLVLFAKRPADAGALAKRLQRPVTFASKELADALGITCGPTKVSIGENGRDLVLHEAR